MVQDKDLYIFDTKILETVKNFLIFNGHYKDYKNFIRINNTSNFIESIQIILLYDKNKKIIDYQVINVFMKKKFIKTFFIKIINFFNPKNELIISKSRFQILLDSKINLSSRFHNETNILLLEIPKKNRAAISQIKHFFDSQNNIDKQNSLLNFGKLQILSTIYLALIFLVLFRVVFTIPFTAINENEIFLATKLILTAFFPFLIIVALLSIPIIATYGGIFRILNYGVYKFIVLLVKVLFFGYFIISASLSIWQLYFINTKKILTNYPILSYPFHENIANWYLDNKVSLVFDKKIERPILFFGIKDSVYYYNDVFDNCKLKSVILDSDSEENKTIKIKKLLLSIDNNISERYRTYDWKIGNAQDLSFDYNLTLINQSILKCNDKNLNNSATIVP